MIDQPPNSALRAFFASVYGKLIAALVIIALLLGIALEYVQFRGALAELPAKTGRAVDTSLEGQQKVLDQIDRERAERQKRIRELEEKARRP
jgi:hypothetical protein